MVNNISKYSNDINIVEILQNLLQLSLFLNFFLLILFTYSSFFFSSMYVDERKELAYSVEWYPKENPKYIIKDALNCIIDIVYLYEGTESRFYKVGQWASLSQEVWKRWVPTLGLEVKGDLFRLHTYI